MIGNTTKAIYSDLDFHNNILSNGETPKLNMFIYGVVVPIISGFGIIANFINGVVLMRPKMTPSALTYLAVLSWLDCTSCAIICITSFTKTMFSEIDFWIQCDMQKTPIFGLTTGTANLILVFVTLDRLVYLKKGLPQNTPTFCTKRVARIMVANACLLATILNIPYFFIFKRENGIFSTTPFFHSTFYMVHNWINFIIVALFPAVFLMIGNCVMVSVIRKWANSRTLIKCGVRCKDKKRYYYQIKLTSTLVAVICLFYIGDIPAHLISRQSVVSLLFAGDITKYESQSMEIVRMVVAVLNAFQLSVNIVVYSILNPAFLLELFNWIRAIILSIRNFGGYLRRKDPITSRLQFAIVYFKKITGLNSRNGCEDPKIAHAIAESIQQSSNVESSFELTVAPPIKSLNI